MHPDLEGVAGMCTPTTLVGDDNCLVMPIPGSLSSDHWKVKNQRHSR